MKENNENKKKGKVKDFFSGLLEKLDKKMKERSSSCSCCSKPSDKDKDSCCS